MHFEKFGIDSMSIILGGYSAVNIGTMRNPDWALNIQKSSFEQSLLYRYLG
ncbi:hypothetical protein Pan110_52920 [Gimesia panareensis]|nr:hypothetical protein Pan110_52920 [Gimesia panareensis]